MGFRLLETRERRVSAALRFEDALASDRKPAGRIRLVLEEAPDWPVIRNAGGWHVFLDLPQGQYTVRFDSDIYSSGTIAVRIEGEEPAVIRHELQPNGNYPFPSHATLLRGGLHDEGNEPLAGGIVEAAIYEAESGYAASLAESAAAGDTAIRVNGLTGKLAAGSAWLIKDGNRGRSEFFRTAHTVVPDANGAAVIDLSGRPLLYPHSEGAFVFALKQAGALAATSDGRGDWVVPMPRLPAAVWFASVSAVFPGYRSYMSDIRFEEGRTTSLGVIKLPKE